jgi:ribonuclease Z
MSIQPTQPNKVILLGTGSVIPNPRRMATSHLLLTSNERILVDCGPGSAHRMAEAGYLPKDLTRVLVTHLHADHCSELASIVLSAFLQGRETPLPIYGPQGTKDHVDLIFSQVFGYIPRLLSARGKKFDIPVIEVNPETVIEDDIKITCAKVIHGPILALGYRIDTENGSVGFSGDTAPCEDLINLVKGVDLLIHECPYPDKNGPHPAHTIPNQLGPIAAKVESRALAMNHFFPMCDASREDMIESVGSTYSGDIIFGEDLMTVEIKH